MDCLSFTSPALLLALYSHVQATDHTSDHTSHLKGLLKPSIVAPTLVFPRQTLSPALQDHHPTSWWKPTTILVTAWVKNLGVQNATFSPGHRASLLAQTAPSWLLNSGRCPFVTGNSTVCTGSQEDGVSARDCSTQQEWGRTAVRARPCHFPLWSWEGGTKDYSLKLK